jgi:peptidoglycan/LPS O-acetylase OafA/YrhL
MEPEVRRLPVRYYEIDLLRFLAALSVVFYHYTFRGYAEGNYSPLPFIELGQVTRYGYLGVELFFIISGYVVLLSAQGKTVRQFVLSRVTRLYPAFWAACTLTFLVERLWGPGPADAHLAPDLHAGLGQYLYNLTMLHEFMGTRSIDGAYWSLTIEITFYFLVSLLIAYRLMPHINLCLALWLGYALLPGVVHHSSPFAQLFFPEFAPYFVAGMLFYLLQQPQGRRWPRYGLLAVAYLLALRSAGVQARQMTEVYHAFISPYVAMGAVTLFFGIFYTVTLKKINLSRFAWLAWLGSLTYPLYLLHSNIGFLIFHRLGHLANKYVLLSGTLLLMLGAAWLVHVLVEKRLSKPLGAQVARWFRYLDRPAQA